MRRTLFVTTLLALTLAPALEAQHRGYPDRGRYDDRRGYSDRGRNDRIAVLARELQETANYVYREAARNNRRPSRAEARVLTDLYQLQQQADRFYYEVRDRRPGSSGRDFAALESAFFQTANSLRYIRSRSYIDQGMDRIYSLMTDMSRYYDRGYRQGYSRWDRSRGWDRRGWYEENDRSRYGRERYRDYYKDDDDDRRHGRRDND